jgi:hypothetical protein
MYIHTYLHTENALLLVTMRQSASTMYMYKLQYIHTYIHPDTRTYTHTHIHTYIEGMHDLSRLRRVKMFRRCVDFELYTHTSIHTHIHTHTYIHAENAWRLVAVTGQNTHVYTHTHTYIQRMHDPWWLRRIKMFRRCVDVKYTSPKERHTAPRGRSMVKGWANPYA